MESNPGVIEDLKHFAQNQIEKEKFEREITEEKREMNDEELNSLTKLINDLTLVAKEFMPPTLLCTRDELMKWIELLTKLRTNLTEENEMIDKFEKDLNF